MTGRTLRALYAAATMVGLVVLAATGVIAARFVPAGSPLQPAGEMARELADLRSRLNILQDTIAELGRRSQDLRLYAGLPAIDSQVQLAGIGGPGTPDLPGEPLYHTNPEIGRLTFGARSDIDALIRKANLLSASFTEITDTLSSKAERFAATPSIMPTAGWLSSQFSRSRYHPILHIKRPHEGIDVSAPMGAPIVAPAAGRVTLVTVERGYGNVLEVNHGNGIVTKYAHCSKILVHVGEHVTRGQVIAKVGNTGLSTGPHLHYEIHVNGKVVDPLKYVLPQDAVVE